MRLIIAHGHIFKNAGSTLDWSLQRSFGDGFLDHRDDKLMREHGTRHLGELVAEQTSLQAISSHHMAGTMPDLEGHQFAQVYLLRNPIQRVRSVYEFERQQRSDSLGARTAKSKTFREYVAWRMQANVPRTIRNYQTIYLAGAHDYLEPEEPGAELFARALEQLRSVTFVGLVDRYDESMVAMEYRLRPALPSLDLAYVKQNVTRPGLFRKSSREPTSILDQLGELASTVISKNGLDLALYQLADRQLNETIAEIPDFEQRLREFRARCGTLQAGH